MTVGVSRLAAHERQASARAPELFANGNRELVARSYCFEHANGVQREPSYYRAPRAIIAFSAPALPQTFVLITTHDFIWSPASKFQAPRELIARKKCRGGARINFETNKFARFLSGDCQSVLTSAATKIEMAGMGVSTN